MVLRHRLRGCSTCQRSGSSRKSYRMLSCSRFGKCTQDSKHKNGHMKGTSGRLRAIKRSREGHTTALRAARRAPAHINRHLHWASSTAVETCRPNRFFRRVRRPQRRLLRTRLRSDSGRALRARCMQLPRLLRPLERARSILRRQQTRAVQGRRRLSLKSLRCWGSTPEVHRHQHDSHVRLDGDGTVRQLTRVRLLVWQVLSWPAQGRGRPSDWGRTTATWRW